MRLMRKWFGPSHSLVLCYDHLTDETGAELESQIAEVGSFYQFSKLTEIARPGKSTRATGRAAIVFLHARRSVFARAIPDLLRRGIPFTLFLDPSCIGANRLPFEDEIAIYQERFPLTQVEDPRVQILERAWKEPPLGEALLTQYRARFGPLPLNDMDSTLYFATWSQINELPPGNCGSRSLSGI